jgi:hypothetical protein
MLNQPNTSLQHVLSARRPHILRILIVSLVIVAAFFVGIWSYQQLTPAHAASASASSPSVSGYSIKVFFSKYPVSVATDSTAVYPVNRVSPTIAVGTFALQLLIAGPTLSEQNAGYFTELNTMLSGSSNCSAPRPVGGPDFTLTLNHKGPTPETGTATVKFCRTTNSSGIGVDARVEAEINATLKQFSNIKKVVILRNDGHCFADNIGNDRCLH